MIDPMVLGSLIVAAFVTLGLWALVIIDKKDKKKSNKKSLNGAF